MTGQQPPSRLRMHVPYNQALLVYIGESMAAQEQWADGSFNSFRGDPPAAPMATGACSRDEPHPKLSPPITTGYFVFISPSWMNLHRLRLFSKLLRVRSAVFSMLEGFLDSALVMHAVEQGRWHKQQVVAGGWQQYRFRYSSVGSPIRA